MKNEISEEGVARTVFALLENNARRATSYLSPHRVVTATRRLKPDKRSRSIDIVLKLGRPNYREREFIARCKKAKEPFPVKKVQLKWWPNAKNKT